MVLDCAGIIVGVRSTDSDAVNFVDGVVGFNQLGKLSVKFVDVVVDVAVLASLDRRACNNHASGVYDTEHGVCATYIDTYYIRFAHFR